MSPLALLRQGIPSVLRYTAALPARIMQAKPELQVVYYNDSALDELVSKRRPAIFRHFGTMRKVEQADVFRYTALWAEGGLYIDSDVTVLKPMSDWCQIFKQNTTLANLDFIIGTE